MRWFVAYRASALMPQNPRVSRAAILMPLGVNTADQGLPSLSVVSTLISCAPSIFQSDQVASLKLGLGQYNYPRTHRTLLVMRPAGSQLFSPSTPANQDINKVGC